jgi:hypothetical protein
MDQRRGSGPRTKLRRLSPPESRAQAGGFGLPVAPGVRKLTDTVPILCRVIREPAASGECRLDLKGRVARGRRNGQTSRTRKIAPSMRKSSRGRTQPPLATMPPQCSFSRCADA